MYDTKTPAAKSIKKKRKKKKTLRLLELRVKMKATLAYVSKVSTTVSTPETMVDKVKQNKWSLSLASQHLNTEQLNSCALLLCSCDNADHYAVPEIAVHGSPTCNWETVVVLVRTPPPPIQIRLNKVSCFNLRKWPGKRLWAVPLSVHI